MRPDQLQRLRELSERLADRFIADADPQTWSAADKVSRDMDQQERGDAYWCRKVAMATGGVLNFTLGVLKNAEGGGLIPYDDATLDKQISEAEKRAQAAVKRVLDKAKDAFDTRVHGKGG